MRLATEEAVVGLLGIQDNSGTRGNAGVALDVTYPAIADKLGTPLGEGEYLDFFSYSIPRFRKCFTPVTYRLTAAFIDEGSFVALGSTDGTRLIDTSSGVALPSSSYILDAMKGTVTLLDDVTEGYQVLLFSYLAGFSLNESSKVLEDIPQWLSAAGALAAVKLLQVNPSNLANKKVSVLRDVQNALLGEVSAVLNPHIRSRMEVTWPDRSVVVT